MTCLHIIGRARHQTMIAIYMLFARDTDRRRMKRCDQRNSLMPAQTIYFCGIAVFTKPLMTRSFKLVAAILVFIFLASGLSAFGACLRVGAAALPKCCGPLCPMINAQSAGTKLQPKRESSPCCNISSTKSIPTSVSQTPGNRFLIAPLIAAEPFASALPVRKTELRAGVPLDRGSPPRSVLCIFLI